MTTQEKEIAFNVLSDYKRREHQKSLNIAMLIFLILWIIGRLTVAIIFGY